MLSVMDSMKAHKLVDWLSRIYGSLAGYHPDTWFAYAEHLRKTGGSASPKNDAR